MARFRLPVSMVAKILGMELAVDPNVGGGVDRSKLPDSDFAGKHRSFPIVTQADVSDALHSIGRAGADNYSHDELHSRIIAIAKRKGFSVPDSSDEKSKEAEEPDPSDVSTPAVIDQGKKMPLRTRRRINTAGQRNVPSDSNGDRVSLPA